MQLIQDKQKSLNIIKILIELREKANPNTMLGISIINAIDNPDIKDKEVIQFVKDQGQDSFKTMSDAITPELTNQILSL